MYISESSEEIEYIGYPVMILANDKTVRFSEPEETLKIMSVKPVNDSEGGLFLT